MQGHPCRQIQVLMASIEDTCKLKKLLPTLTYSQYSLTCFVDVLFATESAFANGRWTHTCHVRASLAVSAERILRPAARICGALGSASYAGRSRDWVVNILAEAANFAVRLAVQCSWC
jgi:hypothetical protein